MSIGAATLVATRELPTYDLLERACTEIMTLSASVHIVGLQQSTPGQLVGNSVCPNDLCEIGCLTCPSQVPACDMYIYPAIREVV